MVSSSALLVPPLASSSASLANILAIFLVAVLALGVLVEAKGKVMRRWRHPLLTSSTCRCDVSEMVKMGDGKQGREIEGM